MRNASCSAFSVTGYSRFALVSRFMHFIGKILQTEQFACITSFDNVGVVTAIHSVINADSATLLFKYNYVK